MSIWFSKRSKAGDASWFSASIPSSLVFIILMFAMFGLLSLMSWLRS